MGIETTTFAYSENRDDSVQFDHTLFLIMPHIKGERVGRHIDSDANPVYIASCFDSFS